MNVVLIFVATILFLIFKLLNFRSHPERSTFYCKNKKFLDLLLKRAPTLNELYQPPRLWGFSGHIQTCVERFLTRHFTPAVSGERVYFEATDGATVTYDLFRPSSKSSSRDLTIAICPGLASSSKAPYVRRVVFQACNQGFSVAVLNHLGVIKSLKLTSPRIFNMGNTQDYHEMLQDLIKHYPTMEFICLGFSMGGNIVTKYLGEEKQSTKILAGISVSQGYDGVEIFKNFVLWANLRRLYLIGVTIGVQEILQWCRKELFTDQIKRECNINEEMVLSSSTLCDIDENYTRRVLKFDSIDEMYGNMSSINYWSGIEKPMIFISAIDDPLVHPAILNNIRDATKDHENFLYIETKYGGHCAFFERGFIIPNKLRWLDRTVVDLCLALGESSAIEKSVHQSENTDQNFLLISSEEEVVD